MRILGRFICVQFVGGGRVFGFAQTMLKNSGSFHCLFSFCWTVVLLGL
jgi:hypothetical protein